MFAVPIFDPEINPHAALLQSESYVSDGEKAWLRFVRDVETKLGHGLDGNQMTDGFCLDRAYDTFDAGGSATEYVAEIEADKAELTAAFGPLLNYPTPCWHGL